MRGVADTVSALRIVMFVQYQCESEGQRPRGLTRALSADRGNWASETLVNDHISAQLGNYDPVLRN